MSALSARLAKIEASLAPSAKTFTVVRTVIIRPDSSSERLPIADAEWARLSAEGYRDGVDELIEVMNFAKGSART